MVEKLNLESFENINQIEGGYTFHVHISCTGYFQIVRKRIIGEKFQEKSRFFSIMQNIRNELYSYEYVQLISFLVHE